MKKVILSGVVVTMGCVALWFWGRPAYRHHQERRALQQAREFLAQGDYRNASVAARRALQVNPQNLDASQIMVELAERTRSPYLLDWRRRIAETVPTTQNKLMLASTALRLQAPPYPLATQILGELKDSATNVAAYHAVAAELALRLKKPAEAIAQFQEASRLEPANELHHLNLAVLELRSTNVSVAAAAHAILERLSTSTNVGAVALRWLVADSLERGDLSAAGRLSRKLLTDPHSALDDRLQHLTILKRAQDAGFKDYLAMLQSRALTNAAQVYAVSAWMIANGFADEALDWLKSCPAEVRAEQPAPLALVDCYLTRKDWSGLETSLQEQKWDDLEFLRFAFLSRAAAELNQKWGVEGHWRMAVQAANDRLGPLLALLNLAAAWERNQAREELLWLIAQRFPQERWTLSELERLYLAAGKTRGLNRVYAAMKGYTPRSFVAENNLAATSLLLKINLPRTYELAREAYQQHPEEAIVASTYAFSLHLQGRTREGLAVLQKLKPDALETPSVALYYGLLLSAAGHTNQAAKYLSLARQSKLLPEEQALAAEALKGLNPPRQVPLRLP